MSYPTSPTLLEVWRELEALRRGGAGNEASCDNQIVGVSDESDTVSGGPGSLLTPEGRGRSRTRGVSP